MFGSAGDGKKVCLYCKEVGRDIVCGCRCAISWCENDLTVP